VDTWKRGSLQLQDAEELGVMKVLSVLPEYEVVIYNLVIECEVKET
jgi:hypothetical protein